MRTARCIVALFALCCGAGAARRPVTLDDVTAERTPRMGSAAIRWAPDGKRFAFREGSSLWQYDVASGLRKEIVSLAKLREKAIQPPPAETFDWQNRSVAESGYQWSQDGKQMLVAAEGDLFLVQVERGEWQQLTATAEAERDPKLSPDGRQISFRRRHDLYTLDIAKHTEMRLTRDGSDTILNGELDWVYPEELDLTTAHWWSPDSKYVAYLQFDISREPVFPHADLLGFRARLEPQRYPKAGDSNPEVRLGVVSATGGTTRWMDVGDPRGALLARVNWLRDSRRIAAERLNRVQNRLDLLVAGISDSQASRLLREEDPYWVNVGDELRFLANGSQFLWSSERDGFRHLYLGSLDGKSLRQITRGEWEVTSLACLDEAARNVYFVATAQSALERHLYRIGLDGKHMRRVTEEKGTHSVSMSPDCGYYLETFSSIAQPPRRTLHTSDGRQIRVYQEPDRASTDELDLFPAEIVQVQGSGGAPRYARLIKPPGFEAGRKYPAIVFIYGGPHVQTVRDVWSGATWEQALAARGFVIWQLDNRGSSGRGHLWESAVFRNLGARELEDQQEGIRHLESLGFVEPGRIGIYGWSYGGFMTLYSLLHAPELFRAGVAGAPVTDWHNYDTIYTERYMGLPDENADGYKRSSNVEHAGALKARLLLVHNFGDDNVHFQNTLQMANALERAGKQFEMLVYPHKSHGVTGPLRRQMLEAMTEFLERSLK